MKKALLFIFILSHTILSAQPADFSVIEGLPFKRVMGMRGGADEKGNVCYVYHSNGYAHYTLIDPSGKVMHQPKFQVDDDFKVVAIMATDKDFCIYYTDASNMHTTTLNLLLLNKTDGSDSTLLHFNPIEEKKENLISLIKTYNALYVITCDKSERKDKKVFLKTYKGSDQYTTTEIKSDMPNFYDHFKNGGFRVITARNTNSIDDGIYIRKIYAKEDALWFVYDQFDIPDDLEDNSTEVLRVDIATGTSEYQVYKPEVSHFNESTNSFLLDSMLFKVTYTSKRLDLKIFHVNSMKLVRQYVIQPEDSFYLKDGPLYKTLPNSYLPKTFIVNKTPKLLRKLSQGGASVLAKRNDSSIQLLLGSYFLDKPSAHLHLSFYSELADGLINTSSGKYVAVTLSANSWEKTAATPFLFNQPHQFLALLQKKGVSFGQTAVFNHPNGTFLAYIDKQEKTIRIVKL